MNFHACQDERLVTVCYPMLDLTQRFFQRLSIARQLSEYRLVIVQRFCIHAVARQFDIHWTFTPLGLTQYSINLAERIPGIIEHGAGHCDLLKYVLLRGKIAYAMVDHWIVRSFRDTGSPADHDDGRLFRISARYGIA